MASAPGFGFYSGMPFGTLYVVATPLGHLGDLSPRAAETLRAVDTVAAEDTRRTRQLLTAIDAHPRITSYHAHSTAGRADALLAILAEGRDVALVTDAGTPGISDPGSALVAAARVMGARVVPIAGPSAVATALSASGLGCDRYLFLGFVPRKGPDRRRLLERAAREPWSIVFFEAPGRLAELLAELITVCGATRQAVVARELTKMHEEFHADTLAALHAHYEAAPPRGEITVIVAGAGDAIADDDDAPDAAEVTAMIRDRLAAGDSRKDVVRMIATRFGLARNEAYQMVMAEP
jgi:16S rRNA (cytidine1402-2'-O)-methyltransferase